MIVAIGIFMLFAKTSFVQEKNPTIYPYGGIEDSKRYIEWDKKIPLTFTRAPFIEAKFDSLADFKFALFKSHADFTKAQFKSSAIFSYTHFKNSVDFGGASFHNTANFTFAKFDSIANFASLAKLFSNFWGGGFQKIHHDNVTFFKDAFFDYAQFEGRADFEGTDFKGEVHFTDAQFKSVADFESAFNGIADFEYTEFDSHADFSGAFFNNRVSFQTARFKSWVSFEFANFNGQVDFRIAQFDSAVFDGAVINNKLILGAPRGQKFEFDVNSGALSLSPSKGQKFNFYRTFFTSNAKLELWDQVELAIHSEKIKYISITDSLSYFLKRDIIENLKNFSFKNDQRAKFELDYIFDKSTMYQEESDYYLKKQWYKRIGNCIYYHTMGLGYHPFRLIWWAFVLIMGFTAIYFIRMPTQINRYISKDEVQKDNQSIKRRRVRQRAGNLPIIDTIINCFYFSALLFFTVRLKKDLLAFFETKEKRIILIEWLVAILTYAAFFLLSKEGSIAYSIIKKFMGI